MGSLQKRCGRCLQCGHWFRKSDPFQRFCSSDCEVERERELDAKYEPARLRERKEIQDALMKYIN